MNTPEYDAEYYTANRARILARKAAYRAANRERLRLQSAEYRTANPEKAAAKVAAWRAAHPERVLELNRRRTALGRAQFIEDVQRIDVWDKTEGICHLCLVPIDNYHDDWEMDHVWPRSWGGVESLDNYAPAHQICNARKHNRVTGPLSAVPWIEARAFEVCVRFHLPAAS